jgi:hypothetical protein
LAIHLDGGKMMFFLFKVEDEGGGEGVLVAFALSKP